MNSATIKKLFPFFNAGASTHPKPIYVDNAATTHKPQSVLDSIINFYTHQNANIHRGLYDLGEGATVLYEQARQKVAQFIHAKKNEEIIFTSGTTHGINFVAQTWGKQHIKKGDIILLSQAEHHANLLPWQQLAHETGAILDFITVDPVTYMFVDPLEKLSSRVKLVAITHESNVIGSIWQSESYLADFIAQAHQCGAHVLLDSAQRVSHQSINVQKLNADFLVFSGHKMYGPTGIGVLYIKEALHSHIPPYQKGGGMVHAVSYHHATWAPAPHKFEAGTPPIASAIGLGATIDFLQPHLTVPDLALHEQNLTTLLIHYLNQNDTITILGQAHHNAHDQHLVSFSVNNVHAHDLASFLGTQGIAVRAGHLCAQPLINTLGLESVTRISFGIYNTIDDVVALCTAIDTGITLLQRLKS